MADHFNTFPLKAFAGTVAGCMDIELPEAYAPGIDWASDILRSRMGGKADRAILFHADAIGQYILQQYTDLFAPVYRHTSMVIPFISTVMSVTPVAHASMYTGLDPAGHGILRYVRPQLTCDTYFDVLLRAGLRPCIVSPGDSTFMHIFAGREMDYFACENAADIRKKVLELVEEDKYDVISIHPCDYDDAAHAYGPESKEALNAVSMLASGFSDIAAAVEEKWAGKHRTLLTFSPDHGQHPIEGHHGNHGTEMNEDMNIVHFFGTKS